MGVRCPDAEIGDLLFDGPDEFGEIVQHNCNRPVRLYVYNARTEEVREVVITPDRHWGGDGCLGADVAHGYLHRLPTRCRGSDGVSVEPDRPAAPNAAVATGETPPPPPRHPPPPDT